jgi:hypothetical protein
MLEVSRLQGNTASEGGLVQVRKVSDLITLRSLADPSVLSGRHPREVDA